MSTAAAISIVSEQIKKHDLESVAAGDLPPVYPLMSTASWGYWRWIRAVADHLRNEALTPGLSKKMVRSLERRAVAITHCIKKMQGTVCGSCGAPMERSGAYIKPETKTKDKKKVGKPCKARSCPRCAAERSAKLRGYGDKVVKHIEANHKHKAERWRHIVITAQYDKSDPECFSVKSIKKRVKGLRKAWKSIWKGAVEEFGANQGAWAAVEIAGFGNIHMHVLHFGHFLPSEYLQAWAKAGWKNVGHIYVEGVKNPGHLAEMFKYPVKSLGLSSEDFMAGQACYEKERAYIDGKWQETGVMKLVQLINPALAARWEHATFSMRVGDRYGIFREIDFDEDAEPEAEERPSRHDETCKCCGEKNWVTQFWKIREWILYCHDWGVTATGAPPGPDERNQWAANDAFTERFMKRSGGRRSPPEQNNKNDMMTAIEHGLVTALPHGQKKIDFEY